MLVSLLLLNRFTSALITSFDEQIRARAYLIAERTNIQPRIVPLPQGLESFTILYTSNRIPDTLFKPVRISFVYPSGQDSFASGNGWRSFRSKHVLENGGSLEVIYALPSDSIDRKIKMLSLVIWLVLPIGSLLAFAIAYWLSSRLLKPVRQVINLANSINLNNDTKLLDEPSANNELKELIVSFNRMLMRIKDQSDRQTAFFASASHELRTPLSVMQTRLQVLLHDQNEDDAVKQLYAGQLKDVKQLNKMVNDFLLLSELRSGKINIMFALINLPEFILELAIRYRDKAINKDSLFKISYHPIDENYNVIADEEKLKIILGNLFENAVKYSASKSIIDCSIAKINDVITITIVNFIRNDINPQVADLKNQFYHSKPIHGEGSGLGLWIANQFAIIQGMELYCTINQSTQFESKLVIEPRGL